MLWLPNISGSSIVKPCSFLAIMRPFESDLSMSIHISLPGSGAVPLFPSLSLSLPLSMFIYISLPGSGAVPTVGS